MTKLFLLIVLLTLSVSINSQIKTDTTLVFTRVSVIDVVRERIVPNTTLIISGGRISALGRFGKIRIPKNAQIIDAKGKFLIPGLWDMHVHIDENGEWMFPLFIANGVTSVRDMGSSIKQIPIWKQMRRNGELMPQLFAAGPIVSGKIGDSDPRMVLVGNRREAVETVDWLVAQGVDFIKVHDWVSRDSYYGLIAEAKKKNLPLVGHQPVSMTAEEISNAGQKSIEHIGNTWGGLLVDCSNEEAQLRKEEQSLIPLTFPEFNPPKLMEKLGDDWQKRLADSYNPAKAKRLARIFKRNQTWFDPTIYGFAYIWTFVSDAEIGRDERLKYMPLEAQKMAREAAQNSNSTELNEEKRKIQISFYQKQLDIVLQMKRSGVGILAGTDSLSFPPIFPGFALHDELEKLVEAGLTPAEALQTSTINPAKFFGKSKEQGSIEVGKRADLVLLDANPLADIKNTKRIRAVIVNGKLFERDNLDEMLKKVEVFHQKR